MILIDGLVCCHAIHSMILTPQSAHMCVASHRHWQTQQHYKSLLRRALVVFHQRGPDLLHLRTQLLEHPHHLHHISSVHRRLHCATSTNRHNSRTTTAFPSRRNHRSSSSSGGSRTTTNHPLPSLLRRQDAARVLGRPLGRLRHQQRRHLHPAHRLLERVLLVGGTAHNIGCRRLDGLGRLRRFLVGRAGGRRAKPKTQRGARGCLALRR